MQTLQKTLILLIMTVAGVLTSAGQHMMIGSARIMRHSINEKEIPSDSLIIKSRVLEPLKTCGRISGKTRSHKRIHDSH